MCFMARHRILQNALPLEVKRTVLREAEERFLHEIMESDEERQMLLDRIKRIRRQLKIA